MKILNSAMALVVLVFGIASFGKLSWSSDLYRRSVVKFGAVTASADSTTVAEPSYSGKSIAVMQSTSGAPTKFPGPGRKWVRSMSKGAQSAGWTTASDKPATLRTGPAETAPHGSEIVGDHWHWPGDFEAVLHREREGRAGRLGNWKVPVSKVP